MWATFLWDWVVYIARSVDLAVDVAFIVLPFAFRATAMTVRTGHWGFWLALLRALVKGVEL